jgi:hypothetical protein
MTSRRRPANRFDNDTVNVVGTASADTSVSSVSTEPHNLEPTPRRRVSPVHAPVACATRASPLPSSHNTSLATTNAANTSLHNTSGTSPTNLGAGTPIRKRNDPYMYNVLGAHASPDMAARTSPIPEGHMSPTAILGHPQMHLHPGMAKVLSTYDFDADENMSMGGDTTLPTPAALGGITTPSTPLLGGYMAACYSSAFPPGQLPKPMPDFTEHVPVAAGRRRSHNNAPYNQHHHPTVRVHAMPPPPMSAAAVMRGESPEQRVPSPANANACSVPTSPTSPSSASPMTRVYRNGRPVPVPTFMAAKA